MAEPVATLPTTTVFNVPAAGATSGWKLAGRVPAYNGIALNEFHPPGCHIQPMAGINIQFP
jgi:hypothetical protein